MNASSGYGTTNDGRTARTDARAGAARSHRLEHEQHGRRGPLRDYPAADRRHGPAAKLAGLGRGDGTVGAELAAAMPGEGGSYLYLREAFRRTRLGTLLPFLFIWQFIFSGPLEIASGYIGFAQYLSYLRSGMGAWEMRLAVLVVGVVVIALLYRGIQSVGRLTVVLWIGMLATVAWIVAAGFAHFDARRAFDFPPHAFAISPAFMAGLGGATLIAMYNFLGYYGICFVGGEVPRPERVMPRSIVLSVLLVGAMYALMTVAIMAVVPWREAAQ